jgi:hypothetical protein
MKANTRELTFKCRKVEMTSKPGVDVGPGPAWRRPAYWPCGVRHKGSASAVWAPMLNCGNLRPPCKGKGSSAKHEAEITDGRSRDGATCSSEEVSVMEMERRGRVIASCEPANCASRRSTHA